MKYYVINKLGQHDAVDDCKGYLKTRMQFHVFYGFSFPVPMSDVYNFNPQHYSAQDIIAEPTIPAGYFILFILCCLSTWSGDKIYLYPKIIFAAMFLVTAFVIYFKEAAAANKFNNEKLIIDDSANEFIQQSKQN